MPEYQRKFIEENPIPARCVGRCKREFRDGVPSKIVDFTGKVRYFIANDAIRAPTLGNVRCFYCMGNMEPLDKVAYAARLKSLHIYIVPEQIGLFEEAEPE